MYLPFELDPQDQTLYAVIEPVRATGSRKITHIVTDEQHAIDLARVAGGYVLEIDRIEDFR